MTGKQEWRRDVCNRTASSSASAPARTQLHLEGEQKHTRTRDNDIWSDLRAEVDREAEMHWCWQARKLFTARAQTAGRWEGGGDGRVKEKRIRRNTGERGRAGQRAGAVKKKGLSGALPHHFSLTLLNILWHGSSHYTPLHPPPSTRGPGDVKQAEAIRDLTIIHRDGKRQSIRTQGALTQVNTRQVLNRANGDGNKQRRCIKARKKRHALIHGWTNTEHSCILHAQRRCVFRYISKWCCDANNLFLHHVYLYIDSHFNVLIDKMIFSCGGKKIRYTIKPIPTHTLRAMRPQAGSRHPTLCLNRRSWNIFIWATGKLTTAFTCTRANKTLHRSWNLNDSFHPKI